MEVGRLDTAKIHGVTKKGEKNSQDGRFVVCIEIREEYLIDMCYCSNLNLIRNMYRCSCIVFDGFDQ